jgi:hypothetical protein
MADLEKWRAKARYCRKMAENAEQQPEAIRTWQILAEGWQGILSVFEDIGTDQKAATSQH